MGCYWLSNWNKLGNMEVFQEIFMIHLFRGTHLCGMNWRDPLYSWCRDCDGTLLCNLVTGILLYIGTPDPRGFVGLTGLILILSPLESGVQIQSQGPTVPPCPTPPLYFPSLGLYSVYWLFSNNLFLYIFAEWLSLTVFLTRPPTHPSHWNVERGTNPNDWGDFTLHTTLAFIR